jgi:hypothetical protein
LHFTRGWIDCFSKIISTKSYTNNYDSPEISRKFRISDLYEVLEISTQDRQKSKIFAFSDSPNRVLYFSKWICISVKKKLVIKILIYIYRPDERDLEINPNRTNCVDFKNKKKNMSIWYLNKVTAVQRHLPDTSFWPWNST